ncbi:putative histidine phosphotransferase [Moniliophthora roreri MCA 2997]|uniref:Histidine phosphotransferase n=2 Tax=Moniliophthora roreri TaxID=221103 RepID=V2X641_MONRO|nr:putative histidine phosphotransferase [Moniliophthora roreri MCA 2997]KAI3603110.1 putative histidine phosphotransferase [Moniliophthora roreri]
MSVATSVSPKINNHSTTHTETLARTSTKEDVHAAVDSASEEVESKTSEDSVKVATSSTDPSSSTTEKEEKDGSEEEEGPTEGVIDMEIFRQILDLDEDETFDFSKEMVREYFVQATSTFTDMEGALQDKNLEKLSSLGHFLKGSSATLGVSAVQSSCEKIQHYGKKQDDKGNPLADDVALAKISNLMKQVKMDYQVAEEWLTRWYKGKGADLS